MGVFVVAFLGTLPPLFRKWSDRQLHLFIAFGAGTILGAIFLHLLPDALEMGSAGTVSAMVLTGFLGILLVERILLGHKGHSSGDSYLQKHRLVGITALVGLSAHSLSAGFSLGVGLIDPAIGLVIFLAIITHKATEAFSLSTILRLAQFSGTRTILLLLIYSFMTPAGALISLPFVRSLARIDLSIPTGLTAGTFLYVATLDLLPEAFHGNAQKYLPFVLLCAGILIMLVIKLFGV
jgi:zinc transporter ZupT